MAPVPQQGPDDRERLLEAVDAMVEREAECPELGLVPARTEAHDQPPARDLVHGRGHLGQHRRGVERGRRDERPEPDPRRGRGDRREQRPDLPRPSGRTVRKSVEEMVADPDRVEAEFLGPAGHRNVLGPADLALNLRQLDAHPERASGTKRRDVHDGSGGHAPYASSRPRRGWRARRRDGDGRGGGIRTHDLVLPKHARCQTAPRPDGAE